ncbi:sugar phosphate isomerase/epimerase [Devosia sp. MC532]|uniref:sugar phosphate isomerase/epimerase family protein n=1 Tax=Devosia sp. MC532 TaxID=2799788 RepID=UPI0018F7AC4A|nr:sugar phosphate isomerase/epimerase [Devosia sp. MC532]MBJ7576663.1 sugar phosphate isomerase/epimerase [Devosia sp. MC532]
MTQLSFQLYSARNYPSLPEFLSKLSSLGYTQVEGYGGLYEDPASFAAHLKNNGLSMPTGHFGLDQLKDTAIALKTAEIIGVKRIYCPFIMPDQRSEDESKWLELAETLAELGEVYTKAGYGFGWHNHDFEFHPTTSGRTPMEIILETAPNIEWECDVAWVIRGKTDPVAWFDKYGDRITAVHVKDIAPAGEKTDEDGWADVGTGVVGWEELIKKVEAKTKAQYFVAEHDKPSDPVRFATQSIANAKNWK